MENFRCGSSSDSNNGRSSTSCHRGHWRPVEDEKLRQLVDQYGPQNWNFIAEHLQGRSGKSCRLRWYNQLDPNINKKPFTEEEEERLLKAHHMHGNRWASIARLFPGRTDNAVKNHYHVVTARKKRQHLTAIHGKRSSTNSFPACEPKPITKNNNTTTSASNFHHERCFGPRLLDYHGSTLGFQSNERNGIYSNLITMSSSSSPSWTISASAITKESLGFDVHAKRKDYCINNASSSICRTGHHHHHQNFTNPFACLSYGTTDHGYGSKDQKIKSQYDSSATLWRLKMSSSQHDHHQQEQGDDNKNNGTMKHKDLPYIDFLGVGIS